jgi:hypothetical protein
LQGVRTGTGDTHQINWRVDNIPDNSDALRAIDVLALTDVDTGNLTLTQRQAIADWVRQGGHLVVTGGPNWQKTQAGVTALLPLQGQWTTWQLIPALNLTSRGRIERISG